MSKITLDRDTFKALASDTRLDILRALDGKNMSLKDISNITKLNKATLHEHLAKLNEAGLVKRKERDGHKWVYYKLTWKGESLLHPENTKIVVMFTTTFITLWIGIIQLFWYVKGTVRDIGIKIYNSGDGIFLSEGAEKCIMSGNETVNPSVWETLPEPIQNLIAGRSQELPNSSIPTNGPIYGLGDIAVDSGLPQGAQLHFDESRGVLEAIYQNPIFLYIAIACFIIFTIFLFISLWRLWENKKPKL